MARRVGFGDVDPEDRSKKTSPEDRSKRTSPEDRNKTDPEDREKSVADRAMDEHRARARLKANAPKPASPVKPLIAPALFLILWIAIFIAVIINMTQAGLSTNIFGLVAFTAISVFVVSKVIRRMIAIARGETRSADRRDNF